MDKRLILAVAGSGKTSCVIDRLNLDNNFLILTYTENNYYNIRYRVFQKFGFLPENIKFFTYFSFLYSFCFRPFLQKQLDVRGINFDRCKNRYAKGHQRFIDGNGRVYSNRLVKLIETENTMNLVSERLQKYFDMIIIDEIQDFAGHDFNLLPHLVSSNDNVLFVGDFYQHTFDTSSDGQVNKNLHSDLASYIARFQNMGLVIDKETLSNSYRCGPSICNFIKDKLDINISSHRDDLTNITFLESNEEIQKILNKDDTVKLFYKGYQGYSCYSNNWGNSKGQDHYVDVCVVLNKNTFQKFSSGKLSELNTQTKNKLYVAITRTKRNLYFVAEQNLSEHYRV